MKFFEEFECCYDVDLWFENKLIDWICFVLEFMVNFLS